MVHVNKLLVGGALLVFQHHCCHAFSPVATSSLARAPSTATKFGKRLAAATIEEDVTAAVFQQDDSNQILGQPIPYDQLTIGIMKETFKGENRVSQTPDSVKMLVKEGFNVVVQAGGKFVLSCFFLFIVVRSILSLLSHSIILTHVFYHSSWRKG